VGKLATGRMRWPARPATQRQRRAGRIANYLTASAARTSWPATVALRILRPLCTAAAGVLAAVLLPLPWWGRALAVAGLLLGRPVRRWWLDVPLAAAAAVAGLWPIGAAVLLRAALTGPVLVRWRTATAVTAVRREFVASMTGDTRDRIAPLDSAWATY